MGDPKLSVVIPTLNEEENLGRCIKSLSEQTRQDFEVIIVDGGSIDDTVDIADNNGFNVIEVEKTRLTSERCRLDDLAIVRQ